MAGYVTEVGRNVKDIKINDKVFALLPGGGYAEYVVTHARNVMNILANMTWEEAAAIPEAFLTAYLNLKKGWQFKKGETVLIHAGASGVGTAAIKIAKEL